MLLHAGCRAAVLSTWETPPGIVVPLVGSAIWYAMGIRAVRERAPGRGIKNWEIGCFTAGWLVLTLALVSPLHPLGEQLFSAHMVQHTLLMTVAAPLLVLGRPAIPFVWALPIRWRKPVGRWIARGPLTPTWETMTRPLVAWIIQAVILWGWHAPRLYSQVLQNETVHALQHTCFILAALLFWWSVLHTRPERYGTAVISLFTTAMHSGALGALITVAPTAWYPQYAMTAPMWGLTALEDQQLAGLVMWIPGGLSYLLAALTVFILWLRASETRVTRRERLGHDYTPSRVTASW